MTMARTKEKGEAGLEPTPAILQNCSPDTAASNMHLFQDLIAYITTNRHTKLGGHGLIRGSMAWANHWACMSHRVPTAMVHLPHPPHAICFSSSTCCGPASVLLPLPTISYGRREQVLMLTALPAWSPRRQGEKMLWSLGAEGPLPPESHLEAC